MPNPQPTQMEQRMEPESIARLFHETYERLAPQFSYETRKASAVPWEQVPENNRKLMIAVATEVRAALARPTADLGDDGELVERLRRAEAYIRIANRSSLHADTVEQADKAPEIWRPAAADRQLRLEDV